MKVITKNFKNNKFLYYLNGFLSLLIPKCIFQKKLSNILKSISFDEIDSSKTPQAPTIGEATRNANENAKTWDGFSQFDEIPITPDVNLPSGPKLTKEETINLVIQD